MKYEVYEGKSPTRSGPKNARWPSVIDAVFEFIDQDKAVVVPLNGTKATGTMNYLRRMAKRRGFRVSIQDCGDSLRVWGRSKN